MVCAVSGSCGFDGAMQQATLVSMAWRWKGKVTRRERFLWEMDAVIV
jgi:hypothetical protein